MHEHKDNGRYPLMMSIELQLFATAHFGGVAFLLEQPLICITCRPLALFWPVQVLSCPFTLGKHVRQQELRKQDEHNGKQKVNVY